MLAAVGPLAVVFKQPLIQIRLQVVQRSIQPFAEGDLIELILKRAMATFAEAIRLW